MTDNSFNPRSAQEELNSCLQFFKQTIQEKQDALGTAPTGHLRVSKHRETFQYYLVTQKGDTHGKYIPQSKSKLIASLAQRDYDSDVLKVLHKQANALEMCLAKFNPQELESLHAELSPARKAFIEPICKTDDEFLQEWNNSKKAKKPLLDEATLDTANGELVRSKSEIIIADTLMHLGIPYHYEVPKTIKVRGKKVTFHPDFTCLNTRTRKEVIWEHFGMLDNQEYANSAVQKIAAYATNGFFIGDNLIVSMETIDTPFTAKQAKQLAEKWLK